MPRLPPPDEPRSSVARCAERLWRTSLRCPRSTLAVVLGLALLGAVFALGLRLEPRIDLLSADDPVVERNRARLDAFGPDLRLLLALYRVNDAADLNNPEERTRRGVLRASSLAALRALHDGLETIDGVARVSSLANAPILAPPPPAFSTGSDRPETAVVGEPLLVEALLDQPLELRRRLGASPIGRQLLLSPRESLTPLYLELDPTVDEAAVVDSVVALAQAVEASHPDGGEILVVGPALVETRLAGHVFDDLAQLVPFSIALVALGLLLLLRRWIFLGTALLHALALEAIVLGGMAALGWSVNLVSVLAPVILVPVGVADLLHLFVRLESRAVDPRGREAADPGGDPLERLAEAFAALQRPMLATTATTALGFLGFLLSPVEAIRQFGATLAAGAVVALLLTLTLDAAVLALAWRPRIRTSRPPRDSSVVHRLLLALRRPRPLHLAASASLLLACGLAALSALALPRLAIEDTWIRNFDPDSRVLRDTRRFEQEMTGTNTLSLVIAADPDVEGARRRALATVERLTATHTVTSGSRGLLSLSLLDRAFGGDFPWTPRPVPSLEATRDAVDTWRARGMALPAVDRVVDGDLERFQVQIFVLNQPFASLEAILERIVPAVRHGAGPGVQVEASGDLAVNVRMVREAVTGQAAALVVLLATVTALLMLLARSVGGGLALALPMLLAIGTSFVAIVELGWPYGIALSMCPTLVVGLSVDFALHLRAALLRRGDAPSAVWAHELTTVLRGIAWNGLLWTAGFALLTASALPPNRALGLLAALVVALSTVLTLAFLPLVQATMRVESTTE